MKNDVSMSHDFLIITTVVVFFVLSAQNGAVQNVQAFFLCVVVVKSLVSLVRGIYIRLACYFIGRMHG